MIGCLANPRSRNAVLLIAIAAVLLSLVAERWALNPYALEALGMQPTLNPQQWII